MPRHLLQLALVLGVIAAAIFAACGQPPPPGQESLVLIANPLSIQNNGATSTLTLTAKDAQDAPGTGTVSVTAASGQLGGGGKTATVTLGATGTGTVTFACNRASDATCVPGQVRIDAAWATNGKNVTSFTNVTVTGPGGDAGSDGGTDGGTDGGASGPGVTLTASKAIVFTNVGDSSLLTARVGSLPDGGGTAVSGAPITFTTSLGTLAPADGGAAVGGSLSSTTNASGQAFALLKDTGTAGNATVTATHPPNGANASTTVQITDISRIVLTASACGSQSPCIAMGARGSGYQEFATLTFTVTDTQNRGAAGVPVTFSVQGDSRTVSQGGPGLTPNGVTDANGKVSAVLQSPVSREVLTVKATVQAGIEASVSIAIIGAKPTNAGIDLQCARVNLETYVSPTPPKDITVACTVKLIDRYGNAVGVSQTVNFVTEAGNVSSSVQTKAFNPTSPSDPAEGTAAFTFNTRGGVRSFPVDVAPFAADPAQLPVARAAEPSIVSGSQTLNPRDGLVTVTAFIANGEEWFQDANNNGVHDTGEQYYDQGEALADTDDDNVFSAGDTRLADDLPTNGQWDGPNGQWDGNRTIWTEYHFLYTSTPATRTLVPSPYSGDCASDAGIPKSPAHADMAPYFPDFQLNRMVGGSALTVAHSANKGSVSIVGPAAIPDSYGFGLVRQPVSSATGDTCRASDPVCKIVTQFTVWGAGYVGSLAEVTGAIPSDITACQPDVVTFTTNVLGVPYQAQSSGAIQ